MLIVPGSSIRVGRDRIPTPDTPQSSSVDEEILAAAGPAHGAVRVSVFCGQAPDGPGSWGFDEDLDPAEVEALALSLMRGQLLTYRRLFARGVCMHVRIDFGIREQAAFRGAAMTLGRQIRDSLPRLDGLERELAELDVWLLANFLFSFAVSVERLLQSTLGDNAASVRMRMARAERVREGLSEQARVRLCA